MLSYALKAFDFLKIQYPNSGENLRRLLYISPVLLAILFCSFFGLIDYNSKLDINIFKHSAFDNISTFVQILPGFYIGALAAIASYTYAPMDNVMSTPTPFLKEQVAGGFRESKLSRRRYLTLMFGYLSAISILSAVFIFIVRLVYAVNIFAVSATIYNIIYYLIAFLFFFVFWQMILVTFFGIYYLADRMHRP
ncbi:hypothetical protein [Acinetobacter puyangensis]|uniref:hypothetical protein n=1 Tax=Acinetobacter puyangensis TaxID=1096779 RepID=UPI003A4D808C